MAVTNIEAELQQILDQYALQVSEEVGKAVKQVAKESAKKLKQTSPKRSGGGDYASGWGYTIEAGTVTNSATVHGKKKGTYRLAHLLENGHLMRNGKRGGQRIHIKPVEEWAVEEFERKIKELVEGIQ